MNLINLKNMINRIGTPLTRTLSILVLSLIVLSFALHTVQIAHFHPGDTNPTAPSHQHSNSEMPESLQVLGEYLHAGEKKSFFEIGQAFLLSDETKRILYGSFAVFLLCLNLLILIQFKTKRVFLLKLENYILELFMKGVLNPKLY